MARGRPARTATNCFARDVYKRQAEDHAYSVSIAAGDYYHIFIVAEQDDQNCLYGDSFVIKLKELPGVVSLLDGYFH